MSETSVVIATDPRQREDAFAVRIAVFVEEQGIARTDELDELDDVAVHAVAYVAGRAVGAGRLVDAGGYGKIGRMAVLASHRGRGVGASVLRALEAAGVTGGLLEFRLSAQLSARAFYEAAGYEVTGDTYDEVGIPHVAMTKRVPPPAQSG